MAGRYPSELSGGQQQRVGIARALASEAKILLMDEPFGALDEITKRALQNELLALQEKLHMTVVFITHDIREALKLGDRVLVMEQGRIAQLGTPEEIRKEPVWAALDMESRENLHRMVSKMICATPQACFPWHVP